MTEEQILELQEENKKLLDEKAVLDDALTKLKGEVERLKKTNQKYYEKLIDTSIQEKKSVPDEEQNNDEFKSVEDIIKTFLGEEK